MVSATRQAMTEVPENIHLRGIACCGFHHVPVFLDGSGEPALPVIMMHDGQLPAFREKLRADGRLDRFHETTRSLVSSAHLPSITEAARDLFPDKWGSVRHVLMSKDYLRYRLTGKIGTENCDATGTNLIPYGQDNWSEELASSIGIRRNWLPPIAASTEIAGELSPEPAAELGLSAGIPVFYGGGDSHCALLGLGCIEDGSSAILLGTNCTLRTVFDRPVYDPQIRVWHQRHVVPERWTVSASSLSGASVLQWVRGLFRCDEDRRDDASGPMETACSEGLYFLPFIHGERCPFHRPEASGILLGLRAHHQPAQMLAAAKEGVCFNLRTCWEIMEDIHQREKGEPLGQLCVAGGGSQDTDWVQLIADVLGREVRCVQSGFAGCLGAAMLAAIGASLFACYEDAVRGMVPPGQQFSPTPSKAHSMNDHYYRFKDLTQKFILEPIK
jgi:xylulokinase